MREVADEQLALLPQPIAHPHAEVLDTIGRTLDAVLEEVGPAVVADLVRGLRKPGSGRRGMTAREVALALVIKQMTAFSYEELAFHLADSDSYRRLVGYGLGDRVPSAKTLQRNIKKLQPETLERLSQALNRYARAQGIEDGQRVRVDCTVTASNIHEPTDSSLLDDCVRVLVRNLHRAAELVRIGFTDHTKRARRRDIGIQHAASNAKRKPLYRDLIKITDKTVRAAERAVLALDRGHFADPKDLVMALAVAQELRHFIPLAKRVVDQARRRVLQDESVPARDKVLSIFEPHTDVIRKDRRETHYGHKLCLAGGASGLFTDCTIEDGNPADATLATQMVERHQERFGAPPAEIAFDGGFASRANLEAIKALGVDAVSFSKKRGLDVADMVGSSRLYRILKNFRAGIEAWISFLKRAFGLRRCTWRGLESFKAYVWGSVIAANLLTIARHLLG